MEKLIYVLAGDFTFIETGGEYKAIINRVDEIFEVEKSKLDNFCEELLEEYESYLIPSLYNGKIEL